MEMDLSGADAAITWQSVGTHMILAVYADDVWFWSLASPSGPRADNVGTFRCDTTPAERAAIIRASVAGQFRDGEPVFEVLASERLQPVNVVRMRAARATPPGGSEALLGASFASIGTDQALIRLDPAAICLLDDDGPWRMLDAPRMGLVSGDNRLLDGLYETATITPGDLGAWLLGAADPGPASQRLRLSGSIVLGGPLAPATLPFEVSAPVALDY